MFAIPRRFDRTALQRAISAALPRAVAALFAFAGQVHAQDAAPNANPSEDPSVVIARTVHPRIAYRALPAQDNPVRTQATTFPAQIFHGTLERSLAPLIGDAELDQHGSAGLSPATAAQALTGLLVPADAMGAANPKAMLGGSAAAPPMGPTMSVGGAVKSATAGIGDLVTGSVMQALAPQVAPTQGPGR
ncbi:hypothetical protein [Lysobacter capsici]|uniref:hypothetical protein n=1 Tax=Lysobacter capsici TaxID=435897 RepID=UPI001C00564C|nr:hypothetical protein [Lysobacter capsici]QWF17259.1 hypothetical protein KME82_00160 [Lysobacter capsici]